MNREELRAILQRLGLSQIQGAHVAGADPRTMRRWCLGERDIAPPAASLFRLLDQVPTVLPVAIEIANIRRERPERE